MKFKSDLLETYMSLAPLPLAIERYWECELQSSRQFNRPILDVGCGEGIFANVLFSESVDVGIDPNAKEIERARTYGKYDELIECFGDDIPKPDDSFNTVFSNSVMEHIPPIGDTLEEVSRLISRDGVIYLTLPTDNFEKFTLTYQILNGLGFERLKHSYVERFNKFWRHYHCYSKQDWESLFNQHGLNVKEAIEYGSKSQCMFNGLCQPVVWFCLCN